MCRLASAAAKRTLGLGALPGFQLLATARAPPWSMSARPFAKRPSSAKPHAGSATPMARLAASAAMPAGVLASRWSTLRAPRASAISSPPSALNWSAWMRTAKPRRLAFSRSVRHISTLHAPSSQ